jgi:hypothetical protein
MSAFCGLNPFVRVAIDIRRMTEFGVGTYIRNGSGLWVVWIKRPSIF